MVNQFGQWTPDYPGQTPYNDPAYMRYLHGQQAAQTAQMNSFQNGTSSPQPMQQPAPQIVQPVQSSPPVPVRSEQEARNWPIAPGNSVTFINEGERYVYTKTSLNQFDQPQFVKYKLVREDTKEADATPVSAPNSPPAPMPDYALRSDMDALRGEIMGEIEGFRARLDSFTTEKPVGKGKKKEADSDA